MTPIELGIKEDLLKNFYYYRYFGRIEIAIDTPYNHIESSNKIVESPPTDIDKYSTLYYINKISTRALMDMEVSQIEIQKDTQGLFDLTIKMKTEEDLDIERVFNKNIGPRKTVGIYRPQEATIADIFDKEILKKTCCICIDIGLDWAKGRNNSFTPLSIIAKNGIYPESIVERAKQAIDGDDLLNMANGVLIHKAHTRGGYFATLLYDGKIPDGFESIVDDFNMLSNQGYGVSEFR